MKWILIIFLGACSNDAITLAHQIDPCAECHAVTTYGGGCDERAPDVAICTRADEIWKCTVGRGEAKCEVVNHRDLHLMTKSEAVCRAIPR